MGRFCASLRGVRSAPPLALSGPFISAWARDCPTTVPSGLSPLLGRSFARTLSFPLFSSAEGPHHQTPSAAIRVSRQVSSAKAESGKVEEKVIARWDCRQQSINQSITQPEYRASINRTNERQQQQRARLFTPTNNTGTFVRLQENVQVAFRYGRFVHGAADPSSLNVCAAQSTTQLVSISIHSFDPTQRISRKISSAYSSIVSSLTNHNC
jgi:hypothetical protein